MELKNLRKEIKKYNEKYIKHVEEMMIESDSDVIII
jgi:hypothetical protein